MLSSVTTVLAVVRPIHQEKAKLNQTLFKSLYLDYNLNNANAASVFYCNKKHWELSKADFTRCVLCDSAMRFELILWTPKLQRPIS